MTTRLAAPKTDETLFLSHELESAPSLVEQNQQSFRTGYSDNWSILRELARGDLAQILEQEIGAATKLILTGHQPELYHPGVWVKNFTAHALARRVDGLPVNIIVDNDLVPARSVTIPIAEGDRLRIKRLAFDHGHALIPWEEATIADPNCFLTFGERATKHLAQFNFTPMLHDHWRTAPQLDRKLEPAFTAVRQSCEAAFGIHINDVRISTLCDFTTFYAFLHHILSELPRFQHDHNTALAEYRQNNQISSASRPVPDLTTQEEWWEAPFWVWRAGDRHRLRLFVHRNDKALTLTNLSDWRATITLPVQADAHDIARAYRDALTPNRMKIRTRALTTTMFCRLFLSDLFIHGIGGALYDQVTDEIIQRFWELTPPQLLVATGTLHLPITDFPHATPEQFRSAQDQVRDIHFSPENYLTPVQQQHPQIRHLLKQKQELIRRQHIAAQFRGTRSERRARRPLNKARYHQLKAVTQQLFEHTSDAAEQLQRNVLRSKQQLANTQVLRNREFSFTLFPREKLSRLLSKLA